MTVSGFDMPQLGQPVGDARKGCDFVCVCHDITESVPGLSVGKQVTRQ